MLLDHGDLERANTYVGFALQCAHDYKSRMRTGVLTNMLYKISKTNGELAEKQAKTTKAYLYVVIFFLLLFLLAVIYITKQNRRLKHSHRALNELNNDLNRNVDELKQTREQLNEANKMLSSRYDYARKGAAELSEANTRKERYIADIFGLCSNYINKLDDYRRNIFHMIVAKRFDDVRELTKSPELSQSEIKELYANFDEIFLKVYPDFVKDFNTLLLPDEQIVLKQGERMNTELRIYALVRLGINDSVKISKFLHISTQTVYNARQRIRNKAIVPREKFAETVRSLGKASF